VRYRHVNRDRKIELPTRGLTLGMALEDDTYHAAVVATVSANIQVANR
jgi:hypothetical protein